ncbi:MAG TPA: hypothetical protein DCL43_14910 [Chitinophagaceae bacterium]|nr:hypothetical protein [Chitinophagaceae bacterium]HAN37354.1 hypothetical protein [Chitinophagaceae bacterium]
MQPGNRLFIYLLGLLCTAQACTPIKLNVPDKFSANATQMHVKGLNGWMIKQQISFGKYQSSIVKRGWNTTTSRTDRNTQVTVEDRLLRLYGVNRQNLTSNQKDKFQYTLENGNKAIEIFAIEKKISEQTVANYNLPILGSSSTVKNYQYTFSAVLLPLKGGKEAPWQMILTNVFDAKKDTARRIFDLPYVEENGFATNGTDSVTIYPVRVKEMTLKNGKQGKLPVQMLSGYELRMDGGVVAIIDNLDRNIWIYNDIDEDTQLLLAAMASALMLRRVHDEVE